MFGRVCRVFESLTGNITKSTLQPQGKRILQEGKVQSQIELPNRTEVQKQQCKSWLLREVARNAYCFDITYLQVEMQTLLSDNS